MRNSLKICSQYDLDDIMVRFTHHVADPDDAKILAILDTHIQFERIHRFSGGDGRTGPDGLELLLITAGISDANY